MPADRDATAVRLVCRRLGAADEAGLPTYVRERIEQELRPLAGSPLTVPDDPLILATAEAIARDWLLGSIATELRGSAREALDASRAWAELRHRETTAMDARRDAMAQRQRDQDARQARLDEREAALDVRQAELDRRQTELDAREASLELRDKATRPAVPGLWMRFKTWFMAR